jgi:putative ABC transport system permease protein
LHGVTATGAITLQTVETLHEGKRLRLFVVGYELDRLGGPGKIVDGRNISRSHYELVADRRAGLLPGDRLRIGRNTFVVVGLTEDRVSSSGDPIVYLTLRDSQELQFELAPSAARRETARSGGVSGTDTVNAVIAQVTPNVSPGSIVTAARRWKHLAAMTQAEQEDILTKSMVERARKQIALFTVILLAVSAVIIALIIYTMTMDKLREIATLKLIGAPDRTIIGLIVQQALAMGAIGFAFGVVLISMIKDYFPRRVILQPADGLALASIVLVVCVLASALGVRLALKVDPGEAVKG